MKSVENRDKSVKSLRKSYNRSLRHQTRQQLQYATRRLRLEVVA